MLQVPDSASQTEFLSVLRAVGNDTLSWYENRIRAIKESVGESHS